MVDPLTGSGAILLELQAPQVWGVWAGSVLYMAREMLFRGVKIIRIGVSTLARKHYAIYTAYIVNDLREECGGLESPSYKKSPC